MPHDREEKEKKFSRHEAEEIFDTCVRQREYWNVDDFTDNSRELQEILDICFNHIEGNAYKVDYQHNQNGDRLVIKCQICCKELSSFDPFKSHENGKTHKKIRQKLLLPEDPNLIGSYKRRNHNEPRGIFDKDSLESMVDSTKLTVLGLQFVYMEIVKKEKKYTCQLCRTKDSSVQQTTKQRMFDHLTSKSHIKKYMEVKFGYVNKTAANFEEEAKRIEELEGKIHAKIVNFSRQLPLSMRSESPIVKPRDEHSSRSPSMSPVRRKFSSSSSSSRSPPPKQSIGSLLEEKILASALRPPSPPKPVMKDIGTCCLDLHDNPRHTMREANILNEEVVRDLIIEDKDMQGLIIYTMHILNNKLDNYYKREDLKFKAESDRQAVPLSNHTAKVRQRIEELNVFEPETV